MKKLLMAGLLTGMATIAFQSDAKAASVTCAFNTPGACTTILGNWAINNFTASSSQPLHFATFSSTSGSSLSANFSFVNPQLNGPNSGTLSYDINYLGTDPLVSFVAGTTGLPSLTPPGVTVVGQDPSNLPNVVLPSSVYSGSTSSMVSFLPGSNSARILYSWNFTGGQTLTAITSEITAVPGPLPILGGGVAFAFSRRLRQRIKAAA